MSARTPKSRDERVHYVPHGGRGFECFRLSMRTHIDSGHREPGGPAGTMRTVYDVLAPRRHSDLTHVTCTDCWVAIGAMLRQFATRTR